MSLPARATTLGAALLAVTGLVIAPAAAAEPQEQYDHPQPLSAVSPLVASVLNDLPLTQVRRMAKGNHYQVDEGGRIRSVEKHAAVPKAKTTKSVPPGEDVFTQHSRPGSNRTIYLDFNGHTVQNTAWNNGALIEAPGWSADSDPTTFSTAERDTVYQAFLTVAEDYSTFDVDVTTEEPTEDRITRADTNDQVYGTRAVITPKDVTGCGCGGQAYIGTFDQAPNHPKYQPAWAYADGSYDGKSIGEIIAHETGHNLGLSHDGQTGGVEYYGGHTNWAPIMGTGYGQPVTTWSRGEYTNANNTEDDLAIIPQNGAATLPDDHPDDDVAALTAGTPVQGVITTDADVDVFKVTHTGGTLKIDAVPAEFAPDLDIKLTVKDATGTVVATIDPPVRRVSATEATGLDAHLSQNLPAGDYTVQVEGTGFGDPGQTGYTGYASIGDYTLSAG